MPDRDGPEEVVADKGCPRSGQEDLTMMDNIPSRYQLRVKQRRRVVEFADDYGFRAAARHFGLARRTVRTVLRALRVGPVPSGEWRHAKTFGANKTRRR